MPEINYKLCSHLLICTNSREGKAACSSQGTLELRDEIKSWSKTLENSRSCRVNASGCLGLCEQGGVAVLYPEGRWFTKLSNTSESKTELKAAILDSLKKPNSPL